MEDLEEKNIDFHSFMANSIETQDLFLDMLDKAEEEIGFKTENYKLMIEAIATSDGKFILTVTRIAEEVDKKTTKKNVISLRVLMIFRNFVHILIIYYLQYLINLRILLYIYITLHII